MHEWAEQAIECVSKGNGKECQNQRIDAKHRYYPSSCLSVPSTKLDSLGSTGKQRHLFIVEGTDDFSSWFVYYLHKKS